MLLQFNFTNYLSFKESAVLDLTASRVTEHPDHVCSAAGDKVVKLAAIFGANASGKTNVYAAFDFMMRYVINSFKYGGQKKDSSAETAYKPIPFMFDALSKESPSEFEVFFTIPEDKKQVTYQYGFTIDKDGVQEEWLYTKTKTGKTYSKVFTRKHGKCQYPGIKVGSDNINLSLENETLVLSLGAKLKINKLIPVRDWFVSNNVMDFGSPDNSLFISRIIPYGFEDDTEVQQRVVKYLASFDNHIDHFVVEDLAKKEDDQSGSVKKKRLNIDSAHRVMNSDAYENIPLNHESSGTLKMFALFPYIEDSLQSGSVLFVDELNAKLHPLLVRNLILTFGSKELNPKGAQLIFTTHDVWQLSIDVLRRDEIWFVEKATSGESVLYPLDSIVEDDKDKIRKDEVFSKNYLYGKYGAIPELKPFDMFLVQPNEK